MNESEEKQLKVFYLVSFYPLGLLKNSFKSAVNDPLTTLVY